MVADGALVAYKNRPALASRDGDRLALAIQGGDHIRVRDKDVSVIHPGPLSAIPSEPEGGDFQTAWEMLSGSRAGLGELAELVFGRDGAAERLACWRRALEGPAFRLEGDLVLALAADELARDEDKRRKKEGEAAERADFVARARALALRPGDERWLAELEALALGRAQKSKMAAELGLGDEPEAAHAWLLKAGVWTPSVNPHPARSGHPLKAPDLALGPDDDTGRVDLGAMPAWAIDNAWSHDPDDAISWDGQAVWVHVADPAQAVTPGCPADLEAANRSGTLYLPEGAIPMLPDQALERFGLGLSERSRALSFRVELGPDGQIASVDIQPSWVRVTRLSYAQADGQLDSGPLAELAARAQARTALRAQAGAVDIELPEVRVWLDQGQPRVEPVNRHRSASVVREMMVLAGEAAARWAFDRGLPFPYYSQEAPGSRDGLPDGLAGEYAKRRLMRAGMAGPQPRAHQGLGVGMYAQVTSPLRRYADLLCHQQIRSILASGSGARPLPADELSLRLARSAAEASAVRRAERDSELHWTLAWLMAQNAWEGRGVVVQTGADALVALPELGMDTRVKGGALALNQELRLRFLGANLAKLDARFGTA